MIDVLIPVYNADDFLEESLKSLANQTFKDFRVLAINDGSTDGSAEILADWAARDSRFTVITKANGGIVDALNAGLAAVTAEYIARLDADDIALPDRFAEQLAYLKANPSCVAVGSLVSHIDDEGQVLSGFPQPGPPDDADMWYIPAREPYIVHPLLLARSDAVRRAGGYRHVPYSEDSDLFWRLSEHGRLHNLPATLGQYRMHLQSISGSSIVNGRIMAVGSQLGAISAQRRSTGKADMAFTKDLVSTLRCAKELAPMTQAIAKYLDPGELPRFRLTTAIKLLELADYRPYELDHSDCVFINDALKYLASSTDPQNFKDIDWYLSGTGRRLLAAGRLKDALTLVPRRLWLRTAVKAAIYH